LITLAVHRPLHDAVVTLLSADRRALFRTNRAVPARAGLGRRPRFGAGCGSHWSGAGKITWLVLNRP